MTLKQFITNLNVTNMKLFFIGYYKTFLARQYAKYFDTASAVDLMTKAAQHHQCVLNGTMHCCGCETIEKLVGGGKCKYDKCKFS